MALDQWPILPTSPNISVPEFPFYESFIESNDSNFNFSDHNGSHQDKTSSVVITFIYLMCLRCGAVRKHLGHICHPPLRQNEDDSLNQFTSIFCLMVMSIDRYLAVVHPIRSTKWRKPRVAKLTNLTVWVVSLIVILPTMIFSGLNKVPVCGIVWPEPQDIYYKAFIFYTFFIGFFLPLSVICLCYLLIIIKVKSSGIRVGSTKRKRSERKVTRMVSIVVAVFVLCWLPFYVFNVTSVTGSIKPTSAVKSTFDFVVVLGYTNSCANPILYAFLSDNFKKSFQNVLC
ncbi:unnamed protein product, partial [Tetraodon nigroviridis]